MQNAEIAASLGQTALAESNHATLSGSLKHIKACNKVGIQPICSVEGYFRPNRLVRDKDWRFRKWHYVLHAKNLKGWHNLIKITSAAFSDGMYQFPCFDWDLLERHHEGMIASTSCILGPLPFLIENGSEKEVDEFVSKTKKIFGEDFYMAIMPHDFDRQRAVNLEIISLANKHGVPIVYEGDSHYPKKGWVDTQKIAILIGTNSTVAHAEAQNKKRLENNEEIYELWHDGLHIMGEQEAKETFALNHPDIPVNIVNEAISNTDYIGSKIEPFLMDRSVKMPRAGKTPREAEDRVIQWCWEGMENKDLRGNKIYEDRLEYELGVIRARGNFDYFFITADWVRWSKSTDPLPGDSAPKKPMRIGSGRGSVAASLVSYLCNITTVDPIAHKLKFERFLNPERKGLPDIDIDFPSGRRNEGKEYQARKNGRKNIADVVAYQTFRPKASLKGVTKTLYGFDSDAFNEIAKICHKDSGLIDDVHDSNLELMKDKIEPLKIWADKYPYVFEQACRLENHGEAFCMRLSKHAGGVVITPGEITNYMPILRSDEKEVGYRTAWSETPLLSIVDDFGFVKWDALAIEGMDQQQMIIDSVLDRVGIEINLDDLPCLKDPYNVDDKVMKAFREGLTLGVNQFSGESVTNFIKKAKPENIVDLAAINALYRPGPMGAQGHIHYARRKNGEEQFSPIESLSSILSDTYYIISFQEQVMDLFEYLADYTPGESDGVRKAIAKLYREKNDSAKEDLEGREKIFIERASEKIGEEEAKRIWSEILPYTDYSFNRAHATGYSIQAYQDMYLKVNYPLEFYCTIMTLEPKDSMRAIKEARNFDIKILPPDVNISNSDYTPDFENNALRYGLCGIKGIAQTSADQVMKLRPYFSLKDFEDKQIFKYSKCNKGHREKLLKVGALDSLGGRADWTDSEKSAVEIELLGISLSPGGTLGENEQLVVERTHSEEEYNELEVGSNVVIGGQLTELKEVKTKKGKNPGQKMGFIKIGLGLDSFQCTLFPYSWSANKDLLKVGNNIMVKGKKDERGIICEGMMRVEDFADEIRNDKIAA